MMMNHDDFGGINPRQALGYWVSYPFDAGGWPKDR